MSHLIELLEPRQLLSAAFPGAHARAAHRLDIKTSQVAIEAKIVQADNNDLRRLGVQLMAVQKSEVRQIGAMLHPLTASEKQQLNSVLSSIDTFGQLFKNVRDATVQDTRAVIGVRNAYALFVNHPGDSFAIGKFSAAIDTLSSTKGVLNGLLSEIPSAQQRIDLTLTRLVSANSNIELRVDAAIANMDAKAQTLSDKAEQLSSDTDQLLNAAEAALQ